MDLVFCIGLSGFTYLVSLREGEPYIAHQCKGPVYFILT